MLGPFDAAFRERMSAGSAQTRPAQGISAPWRLQAPCSPATRGVVSAPRGRGGGIGLDHGAIVIQDSWV